MHQPLGVHKVVRLGLPPLRHFATRLRWLLQDGRLFVQVHERLARLRAQILLQVTVLRGDDVVIAADHGLHAVGGGDRLLVVAATVHEELFDDLRCADDGSAETFGFHDDALRGDQTELGLQVLGQLVVDADVVLWYIYSMQTL